MEYLNGKRKTFDIKYEINGTEFQKKVWEELTHIPYGETSTYKEIAVAVGNPKASRAVGMANNKNPISIVVPCHRVIGSDGKLVGYAGGFEEAYKAGRKTKTYAKRVGLTELLIGIILNLFGISMIIFK